MPPLSEEETKRIFKEALHEWLNEKYAQVGRWTLHGIGASLVGAVFVFVIWTQGWHK